MQKNINAKPTNLQSVKESSTSKKLLPVFAYVNDGYGTHGFFRKPNENELAEMQKSNSPFVSVIADRKFYFEFAFDKKKSTFEDTSYVIDEKKHCTQDFISQELFDEIKKSLGWSNRYRTKTAIEVLHNVMFNIVGRYNDHTYRPDGTHKRLFAKYKIAA